MKISSVFQATNMKRISLAPLVLFAFLVSGCGGAKPSATAKDGGSPPTPDRGADVYFTVYKPDGVTPAPGLLVGYLGGKILDIDGDQSQLLTDKDGKAHIHFVFPPTISTTAIELGVFDNNAHAVVGVYDTNLKIGDSINVTIVAKYPPNQVKGQKPAAQFNTLGNLVEPDLTSDSGSTLVTSPKGPEVYVPVSQDAVLQDQAMDPKKIPGLKDQVRPHGNLIIIPTNSN